MSSSDGSKPISDSLKNALDLIPLLWTHLGREGPITQLLELISQRSSSKEAMIGLLEVQERLSTQFDEWEVDDDENNAGERFCTLLKLYSNGENLDFYLGVN